MRFSSSIVLSIASLSVLAAAVPWASPEASFGLEAREAYPIENAAFGLHAREAEAEAAELIRRAKAKEKNVDIDLAKESKNFKPQDKQNAKADACDALNKAGCTHGTITHAWHTSNDESEEHMSIKPTGGDNKDRGAIHYYRGGKVTQGPGGKYQYKRDLETLAFHRRNILDAREAYAEALNAFAERHFEE